MTNHPPKHPDIIFRPDLQSRGQRNAYRALTVAAWAIWLYLLAPLLSLLAWWLGADLFGRYMLDPAGRSYLITLTLYAVVIAAAALVIVGWSRYNQIRFTGRSRRKPSQRVTNEMISERFKVSMEDLRRIHASRVIVLELDDQGEITAVKQKVGARPDSPTPGAA